VHTFAVFGIADNRVANMFQVPSDLMLAAGYRLNFQ
jgi:hypothetical protein